MKHSPRQRWLCLWMAIALSAKKGFTISAWSKQDDSAKGAHIFKLSQSADINRLRKQGNIHMNNKILS